MHELAIIGAGVMAEAIARGVLAGGMLTPDKIVAVDVSPQRRELFQTQLKIDCVESIDRIGSGVKIVLLSVKPYQMQEVLGKLAAVIGEQAAGDLDCGGNRKWVYREESGRGKEMADCAGDAQYADARRGGDGGDIGRPARNESGSCDGAAAIRVGGQSDRSR